MAATTSPVETASSKSGLSAEQLRRMEENKRKAREKLASRILGARPANSVFPPSTSALLPRQSLPVQTNQSGFVVRNGRPNPNNPTLNMSSPKGGINSQGNSKLLAGGAGKKKVVELVRPTIKATLRLVSRERFEVVMPYDRGSIEVFKKTPTNSYNAGRSIWSFDIKMYDKLVGGLQKECRHVELSQIPRPVVSLFQSPPRSVDPVGGASEGWSGVEPSLSSTLMEFQREGVNYCIQREGRALLADDMGLGKTLQALAVMSHYRCDWPLLIICPSSVKMTWAEACKRWVPSLTEEEVTVVATGKLLSSVLSHVTIISYDLATRLSSELAQRKPAAIIVDESHFLKNFKTNRCRAILPLIKSATRCLLLSGTPALSRPIELYTQISSLDKSFNLSRNNFGIRYCSGVKGHFGWDFSGASNLNELHLYMQTKFMIRRLKNDVLDQLPSKRRQTVLLDPSLTKAQSREVRELKKDLQTAGTCKAIDKHYALLPLFEKTGRLKLPAVRGYILDLLEGGRKLIVFAHHKSVLDSLSESLIDKGYDHIRIDGRTPAESRQLMCDRFQHDDTCLVALLSITTANAGLTLTAASTVVFAELFWNPGILVQAEDRAYRIGQKNSVVIHYLVAQETVDDFIWPLIQSKLTVLNRAGLAGDDFSTTESTVLKGSGFQRSLLEFLEKEVDGGCGGDNGINEDGTRGAGGEEEEREMIRDESDLTTDTRGVSEPSSISRNHIIRKNKRKRQLAASQELFLEDDPDFCEHRSLTKKQLLKHCDHIPRDTSTSSSQSLSTSREITTRKNKSAKTSEDCATCHHSNSQQHTSPTTSSCVIVHGESNKHTTSKNTTRRYSQQELRGRIHIEHNTSKTESKTSDDRNSRSSDATTVEHQQHEKECNDRGSRHSSVSEADWLPQYCDLDSFTIFDDDND